MSFYNDEHFDKQNDEIINDEIVEKTDANDSIVDETFLSDNNVVIFEDPHDNDINVDFIKTKIIPEKEKRYVSIPTFVVSIVLICTLSVFGGAFLANSGMFTN